ncbi:SDR family oxidoreductase [Micromonospora sp. LOL_021]|uniref:SDR family oxidoreductase n=1 Tax=Micromonospora sp. LOL_021 TaxID=3345417 RepID=UPI003A84F01D
MSGEQVLVTGGSGFVGAHCVVRLLLQGYRVRTTVRSSRRAADVRTMLQAGGAEPGDALSFAVADLTSDDGWAEAVTGCDYVLHVASPVPLAEPRDENELIGPARDGVLRVLGAARTAGVKRTVLTSSIVTVKYGHPADKRLFTEQDWTDPEQGQVSAYAKSKLLAERAAWDFVRNDGQGMELTVVNPVGIFGPALGPDKSLWSEQIDRMLTGRQPVLAQIHIGVVDVRDVADLHVRAMTDPAAAGERFLASAGTMSMRDIAVLLRTRLGDTADRVSTRVLPDWAVRLAARFSPRIAFVLPELGAVREASSEKARRMLGWQPRPAEEAVIDMANSLIQR